MSVTQPQLVTADEVAKRFGVARSTVTRWAQSGRLPEAIRLPGPRGPRLFYEADVEQLESQLEKVTSFRVRRGKSA